MRLKAVGKVTDVEDSLIGIKAKLDSYGEVSIKFKNIKEGHRFMEDLKHKFEDLGPKKLPKRFFGRKLVEDHKIKIIIF